MPNPYQLILLDFDGTLCDTRPSIAYSITATCHALEITPPTPDKIDKLINQAMPAAITLQHIVSAEQYRQPEFIAHWRQTYQAIYQSKGAELSTTFADVVPTIATLKTRGHTLVVVSNKNQVLLEEALQKLQIDVYLSATFGDLPPRPTKPDSKLWSEHIATLFPHATPQDILMVGDARPDIEFAKQCGFDMCLIQHTAADLALETQLAPRHVISNFKDLLQITAQHS